MALRLRPGWHDYPLEGSRARAWPAGFGLVRVHGAEPGDVPLRSRYRASAIMSDTVDAVEILLAKDVPYASDPISVSSLETIEHERSRQEHQMQAL